MGYFNIIESLKDIEVNEDMKSMTKDKKNKDVDKLVEALLKRDIDFIPNKYIKSEKSFYNRSSFNKGFVDNVISWTKSLKNKNPNGRRLCMICLGDGDRFIMISEVRDFTDLCRCFIFKVPDEDTMKSIFGLACEGKMTFDINNPKLDGCKLITDTYCTQGADFADIDTGREVITGYTRILNDTVLVMEYMFNILIRKFKRSYGDKYEYVVGQIADLCVNFEVSVTDDGFAVTFDFGGARNCNKIEKILKAKRGSAFCYIYKDGKSKIKLS